MKLNNGHRKEVFKVQIASEGQNSVLFHFRTLMFASFIGVGFLFHFPCFVRTHFSTANQASLHFLPLHNVKKQEDQLTYLFSRKQIISMCKEEGEKR